MSILDDALAFIRKHHKSHHDCDDPFYSCPRAEGYCGPEEPGVCLCGKDEADAILSQPKQDAWEALRDRPYRSLMQRQEDERERDIAAAWAREADRADKAERQRDEILKRLRALGAECDDFDPPDEAQP